MWISGGIALDSRNNTAQAKGSTEEEREWEEV